MEFTKRFLRAKSPCADGFRWFSRNVQDGAGYQQALDTLVAAGRVDDACWLLDQFGPTNEVLTLDTLDAEALVFAGTLVVRGAIAADRLRVGRALRAGAGLRTDGDLGVGEDLRVEGALACGGALTRIFHRSRATNEDGIALVCPKIQVSNLDQRAGNAEAKLYRRN